VDPVGATVRIALVADGAAGVRRDFGQVGDAGKEAGRDLERAFDGSRGQFDKVAAEAKKAGREVGDAFDGSGAKASSQFEQIGDSAKRGLGKIGGFAKEAGGALLAGLGIGVGLDIGQRLADGITGALEKADIRAKLAVQLGAEGKEAGNLGRVAGKVYAENFGDSLGEAAQAVKRTIQDIGDVGASEDGLKRLSELALNTAHVFDQDLGGVTRAVGQLLRTGLVKDAQEGFDVLTAGFQAGNDKADDLLDTLNEYGTQFRKLGLSGQTAMGIITQGLQAGARDADIVADAIKEFAIRAVDGSKLTADGFKALGLNAKDMADKIGQGGSTAQAALQLVLDKLRGIEDPVKRSQAAIALFGTQAEDLGDALFAIDPAHAVDSLGQVAGAAQRAADTIGGTPLQKIEGMKRALQGWVTTELTNAFTAVEGAVKRVPPSVWDSIKSSIENLKGAVGGAFGAWLSYAQAMTGTTSGTGLLLRSLQLVQGGIDLLSVGLHGAEAAYFGITSAINTAIAAWKLMTGDLDGAKAAWDRSKDAANRASQAIQSQKNDVSNLQKNWQTSAAAIEKNNRDVAAAAVVSGNTVKGAHVPVTAAVAGAYAGMAAGASKSNASVGTSAQAAGSTTSRAYSSANSQSSASLAAIGRAGQTSASTASAAHAKAASESVSRWSAAKSGIAGVFAGAGGILVGAGASIMSGLYSGLVSVWNNTVLPWLRSRAAAIANAKGPPRVDRKILIPAGLNIMQGLKEALESRYAAVRSSLQGFTRTLASADTFDGTFAMPSIAVDTPVGGAAAASRTSTTVLELRSSGSRVDDLLLELLRGAVRSRGGDVQLVLGR
jgi:phage-related minor tail protein